MECVNESCRNAGFVIDVGDPPTDPETGEPLEWSVVCGPCGADLTPRNSDE